ncbi:MAG TPA: hypothetical protein VEQ10_07830 [Vicinamibacteria bacterium]|nr:hypothetical protein [Vicinamibacteria bacterium]
MVRVHERLLAALLVVATGAPAAPADDHETTLFPDAALHFEGARYAPDETDLEWTTWIGAGLGVFTLHRTTGYVAGDVETILGSERKPFDAYQVNYHLEGGFRRALGRYLLVPFFHHVSRHLIDRPKTPTVDWNVVGVRLLGSLPPALGARARYAVGVGHTVETTGVAYAWELTARLESEVWRWSWGQAYLRLAGRAVTSSGNPVPPQDGFLDFTAEAGMRLRRAERRLDAFVAFEHRNDVLLLQPGSRDRALFGLRLASSPLPYLDPVWP